MRNISGIYKFYSKVGQMCAIHTTALLLHREMLYATNSDDACVKVSLKKRMRNQTPTQIIIPHTTLLYLLLFVHFRPYIVAELPYINAYRLHMC